MYGVNLRITLAKAEGAKKLTRGQRRKTAKRVLDPVFEENFLAGRVYAMVSLFSLHYFHYACVLCAVPCITMMF